MIRSPLFATLSHRRTGSKEVVNQSGPLKDVTTRVHSGIACPKRSGDLPYLNGFAPSLPVESDTDVPKKRRFSEAAPSNGR